MKPIYIFLTILISTSAFGQGPLPRMETNLDDVYSQYGLSGDGVTIVMLDRGIDYRHPDFIDENGNTRIAYIYDLVDNSGANDPDNPFGFGTIWNEAEINSSLINGGDPLSTDRHGHGTATTGIAAGNGTGTMDLQFQGVAPEATLIVIKITHDPFPAFGNQPAQTGFFNPGLIPVALDFARAKIDEIGQPSVTLMNIGSIGGPTDGTSIITREIDQFINDGYPFVCGVGDDGGQDNHASGTVVQGQTIEIEIQKGEAGFLRLDLWYSEDDRFEISIERPNGTVEGPFAAPTGPSFANDNFLSGISIFHRGADVEFFGATSNRRELLIDFSGATGTYKVILTGTSITDGGSFNASLNPATYSNNNRFTSFVTAGYSVADYAASFNGITPTDYVVKNEWFDVNGIFRDITGQGEDGEIWLGSSAGPTYDNRQAVDFAIPGEVCFAAYRPDTYYHSFTFNQVQNGDGNYGIQNAVSAAAPLATGIIALMLEANPNLTPSEIRSLLQQSCISDSFTGTVPNETWGHGKLDALLVIQNTLATVNVEELQITNEEFRIYPNPVENELNIYVEDPSIKIEMLEVFDSAGNLVMKKSNFQSNNLQLDHIASGVYLVGITTPDKYYTKRIFKK